MILIASRNDSELFEDDCSSGWSISSGEAIVGAENSLGSPEFNNACGWDGLVCEHIDSIANILKKR